MLPRATLLILVSAFGCHPKPEETSNGAVPAPMRAAEPAPWGSSVPVDLVAFPSGVQVGDPSTSGAYVSLHSGLPTVDRVLFRASGEAWEEVARESGLVTEDGRFTEALADLEVDTAYTIVFFDPAGGGRSDATRFRTALDGDGWRVLTLGATSCFGRWADERNGTFSNATRVAEEDPDVFLLLGDSVYEYDVLTTEDYREEWTRWLTHPDIRGMFQHTAVGATWDDHEVANDWKVGKATYDTQKGVTQDQVDAATQAFAEAIPRGEGAVPGALWRKLSWGSVADVFVLDSRGERDWVDHIVSDEQLAWVIDGLHESQAVFKIVIASVHVTDHSAVLGDVNASDRWQGYPEQRDALVAALAETPGAFVITGDLHYGGIQHLDPIGGTGEALHEVAVGPVGSEVAPVVSLMKLVQGDAAEQYELLVETWTSTSIELDPGTATAEIRFVDDAGVVIAEETLDLGE